MRLSRLSIVSLAAFVLLLLVAAAPAGATSLPRTYRVLVGAENTRIGADIMSYFPTTLRIHVGDRVRWVQNSNEIHTVTFLGGTTAPELVVGATDIGLPADPSPMVLNPAAVNRVRAIGGLGNVTTFVNSGLMGFETGQFRSFSVTFTRRGTYQYLCLVHGQMMSGTVKVVARSTSVPSPLRVKAIAREQIARKMAKVPAVMADARSHITPPVENAGGGMTHFVMMGFGEGQIDLLHFFPKTIDVQVGDKVAWQMTAFNDAPHTLTFLNGATAPPLVIPVPQMTGPPVLYLNPAVLDPSMPTLGLMRTGIYNSGFMPPIPGTSFEIGIGAMTAGTDPYVCLLHDESGMRGTLVVQP